MVPAPRTALAAAHLLQTLRPYFVTFLANARIGPDTDVSGVSNENTSLMWLWRLNQVVTERFMEITSQRNTNHRVG